MDGPLKRKVRSQLNYTESRPSSPLKSLTTSPSLTTLRPKAKVNTSATPRTVKQTPSSIPRPASPTKPAIAAAPRIRAVRSSLETTDPNPRPRAGSTLGTGSRSPRTGSPRLPERELAFDSQPQPIKIKSKVSSVARPADSSSSSLSPPLAPSPRVRAPSISSSLSLNSSPVSSPTTHIHNPTFYPITTATPAANPHRFATTRASPPPTHHYYQPFSSPVPSPNGRDDSSSSFVSRNTNPKPKPIVAKVDPTNVPLPPQSPSTSALSLSSRSSISGGGSWETPNHSPRTKTTSWDTPSTNHHRTPSKDIVSAIDTLVHVNGLNLSVSSDAGTETEPEEDEEAEVRAEAKSNRKIADLEISNRSLLAINSMLESTRNRQAKEIRELRRKLRESRLILPPRTYRTLTHSDSEDLESESDGDEKEGEEEKGVGENGHGEKGKGKEDDTFLRLRMMVDDMIETGKKALASTPKDFGPVGRGGAKVLTEDEVRSWRGGHGEDDTIHSGVGLGTGKRGISPSRVAIPSDSDSEEEDEVARMTIPSSASSGSEEGGPPIRVTEA
ncbi:hypothetical protein VNI00_002123 [Paramarasmius palmivorus]|uniref:Uncharacterized protein n=1 Tax=Paramarasmius palmivorus TaxID=297713 RepID=A0AAW0E412_9AGAR